MHSLRYFYCDLPNELDELIRKKVRRSRSLSPSICHIMAFTKQSSIISWEIALLSLPTLRCIVISICMSIYCWQLCNPNKLALLINSTHSHLWDFLIGHFLGIDTIDFSIHLTFEVARKLQQNDDVLERVVDTLEMGSFLVLGDNGMNQPRWWWWPWRVSISLRVYSRV